MTEQDFDCNDGDGRCYDCPHTEQCDYYKYLLGEKKDEGLTYFEKINQGGNCVIDRIICEIDPLRIDPDSDEIGTYRIDLMIYSCNKDYLQIIMPRILKIVCKEIEHTPIFKQVKE